MVALFQETCSAKPALAVTGRVSRRLCLRAAEDPASAPIAGALPIGRAAAAELIVIAACEPDRQPRPRRWGAHR